MKLSNNQQAFFALIKAGLWTVHGEGLTVHGCSDVDWEEVYRLAEEQSVMGLVAAGLEVVQGEWLKVHGSPLIPQDDMLQFVGQVLQIEQENKAMNEFVAMLIEKLRDADVYAILVKGQGIAQCYEKPLWRANGDVDLLLDAANYQKAKEVLLPIAQDVEQEYKYRQHQGLTINGEVVELHGSLRGSLSKKINTVNDNAQKECFEKGKIRTWRNGKTDVFLPASDNDIIFVFTHILQHFFIEGVGLRQICDLCRLLWTFHDVIDIELLESRLKYARLMSEWKAFGAFAIEYLGMPVDAVPLFDIRSLKEDGRLKRKADCILEFVLECGNFGHNRDLSYYSKYSYLVRKVISLRHRCGNFIRHARIFPLDSFRFFPFMMYSGLIEAFRGMKSDGRGKKR